MLHLVRVRLWSSRHPIISWLIVLCCAAFVGRSIIVNQRTVIAARNAWGQPVTVFLADRDAAMGDPIVVRSAQYPRSMVPAGALKTSPRDPVARHRIEQGEILVRSDIAPHGLAELISADAVGVPVPSTTLIAGSPGDSVRVFADGVAIGDGIIISLSPEGGGVIAVDQNDAAATSLAASLGSLSTGLLGG